MALPGVGVAAEVLVVVPALEVLVDPDHLVDLGPHVGPDHLGGDGRVVGHADGLAHVVQQRGEHHLVVGTGALGHGGRLEAVGELVGGEAVGDVGEGAQQLEQPFGDPPLVGRGLGPDLHPVLEGGLVHAGEGRSHGSQCATGHHRRHPWDSVPRRAGGRGTPRRCPPSSAAAPPDGQHDPAAGAGVEGGTDARGGDQQQLEPERRLPGGGAGRRPATASRFQMPVTTSTAKADQARTLKRRAARRGASGEGPRSVGTSPASVSWPPTQTVAASTWRNRRIVVQSDGRARAER